jgi:hypothetical protein
LASGNAAQSIANRRQTGPHQHARAAGKSLIHEALSRLCKSGFRFATWAGIGICPLAKKGRHTMGTDNVSFSTGSTIQPMTVTSDMLDSVGDAQVNNLSWSKTSINTNTNSTTSLNGKAAETTMKQQVSALVGDGKSGQYASHAETSKAMMSKYQSLSGTAKTEFAAKAAAIGAPLGLNFGIKGADGKALNSDVVLTGEAKDTHARLLREFNGVSEPTTTAGSVSTGQSATDTTTATTRGWADTTDGIRRDKVKKGVDAMDTSGDGKISTMEVQVFAAKRGTPVSDAAYAGLLQQAKTFEKNGMAIPKTDVVDFLLNSDNKGTKFVNNDVAKAGA